MNFKMTTVLFLTIVLLSGCSGKNSANSWLSNLANNNLEFFSLNINENTYSLTADCSAGLCDVQIITADAVQINYNTTDLAISVGDGSINYTTHLNKDDLISSKLVYNYEELISLVEQTLEIEEKNINNNEDLDITKERLEDRDIYKVTPNQEQNTKQAIYIGEDFFKSEYPDEDYIFTLKIFSKAESGDLNAEN